MYLAEAAARLSCPRRSRDCAPVLLSVFQATVVERRQRSFEDIHDGLIDAGVLNGPGIEIEVVLAILLVDRDMDDLLGVSDDGKIWIVRHEDDLPSFLSLFDEGDQDFINTLVVEVIFG